MIYIFSNYFSYSFNSFDFYFQAMKFLWLIHLGNSWDTTMKMNQILCVLIVGLVINTVRVYNVIVNWNAEKLLDFSAHNVAIRLNKNIILPFMCVKCMVVHVMLFNCNFLKVYVWLCLVIISWENIGFQINLKKFINNIYIFVNRILKF